jgi:hypothetical protein
MKKHSSGKEEVGPKTYQNCCNTNRWLENAPFYASLPIEKKFSSRSWYEIVV